MVDESLKTRENEHRAPLMEHLKELRNRILYSAIALGIHALIAIPAVLVRLITDFGLGCTVFQAVKPKKRVDLY